LGDKFLKIVERAAEDTSIQVVMDNQVNYSREGAYSFYILWICSHAYTMHKRNVLDDKEWVGWVQWMRYIFRIISQCSSIEHSSAQKTAIGG
jgi:hypothetical protein